MGNRIYFTAPQFDTTNTQFFVTDGTTAGTTLVTPPSFEVESKIYQAGGGILVSGSLGQGPESVYLINSSYSAEPDQLVVDGFIAFGASAGGKTFFEITPFAGGDDTQLWVSDGTAAGTQMLMDFQNGIFGGGSGPITPFGNDVLFSAPAPQVNGFTADQADNELWISDGTVAGTHEVENIDPPSSAGSLAIDQAFVSYSVFTPIAAAFGNELVFAGLVNGQGPYLMVSGGTQATTGLLEVPPAGQTLANIQDLTVVGGNLFFVASDGADQLQLWATDGALRNATMLTGPSDGFLTDGSLTPSFLTAFNGKLYFFDTDAAHDIGLFVSDGTVAGTQAVVSVDVESQPVVLGDELVFYGGTNANGPGIFAADGASGDLQYLGPSSGLVLAGIDPNPSLVVSGSKAFFALGTAASGDELWVTDGTAAGTKLVDDIAPGALNSNPSDITAFDGGVVFTANDAVTGDQVWFSDGTAAGTFELRVNSSTTASNLNLNPHSAGIAPPMVQFGGRTYFIANDGFHGIQLWSTDGTTAGTQMLGPFAGADDASFLTPFGSEMFFSGPGSNPWVTNGTFAGTTQLSSSIVGIEATFVVDGKLFFAAQTTPASLPTLFTTDGTPSGTVQVETMKPTAFGTAGSFIVFSTPGDNLDVPGLYAYDASTGQTTFLAARGIGSSGVSLNGMALNGRFFFDGTDGVGQNGPELWVTNGTQGGTFALGGSNPQDFTLFNQALFFVSAGATPTIWSTNGGGASQVATVSDAALTGLSDLTANGADLYFVASFSNKGPQLWDFSQNATHEVQALAQTSGISQSNPVAAGGVTYFQALDAASSVELWGVSPGGTPIQLTTTANGGNATSFVVVGSQLFFIGNAPGGGSGLFVTNGTAAGTTFLTSFSSVAAGMQMAAAGGVLYFQDSDPTNGAQLWESDGTVAGTHRVSDALTPESADASQFTVADGQVFFSATDGVHGLELWTFNGSQGGAQMAADINPGSAGSNPTNLTAFDGKLFFLANNGSGEGLWSSTGAPGGTVEITSASNGGTASEPTVVGDKLFFIGTDSAHGTGLFETTGTAAGTEFLAAVSQATSLVAVGSELYFQGFDAAHGIEIWKSDGTVAGTVRVTDTVLDNGSFPQDFTGAPSPIIRSDFDRDGKSDFLIENAAGSVVVGEVTGGVPAYAAVTGLGSEWSFKGNGDFLDDGADGFLIENLAGAVFAGEVTNGAVTFTQLTGLGPEWTFEGTGNLLNGGQHDQFLIENSAGAVDVGSFVGGSMVFT